MKSLQEIENHIRKQPNTLFAPKNSQCRYMHNKNHPVAVKVYKHCWKISEIAHSHALWPCMYHVCIMYVSCFSLLLWPHSNLTYLKWPEILSMATLLIGSENCSVFEGCSGVFFRTLGDILSGKCKFEHQGSYLMTFFIPVKNCSSVVEFSGQLWFYNSESFNHVESEESICLGIFSQSPPCSELIRNSTCIHVQHSHKHQLFSQNDKNAIFPPQCLILTSIYNRFLVNQF